MTNNPTQPNTLESDAELQSKIEDLLDNWKDPKKITEVSNQIMALLRKDREAVAREAMINELRILEREDAQYPPHELDIPDYIEYRLTALNQEKQKGERLDQ